MVINQHIIILGQVSDFLGNLFSTESWPARWNCGTWTEFHGWLYICSDLAIWAAYFVIPFFILKFLKAKPNMPLPQVFWLFGAFILFCGLSHLMDAILFWWPGYRLSALIRFLTAIVSWITIIALYKYLPLAVGLKTASDFEAELMKRKKSELKFMGLLESAPDAMIITNGQGDIMMINAQTERIFGFQREEIIGKKVEQLVPERFHHKHTAHREGYVESPKVRGMGIGMDLFGKRKDGSEFPVEISLSPLKINEEEGLMVISTIRDVTKQKGIEAEIKLLNENLEKVVVERTAELELALASEKAARAEMNQNQIRLSFLTESSNMLASSLDYLRTVSNMAQMVIPLIADWCTIDEVREDGSLMRIAATHANPEKVRLVYELAQKYPPDLHGPKGLLEVIRSHKSELYHEINDDFIKSFASDQHHLALLNELEPRSAIIVPLHIKGKTYGVMTLVLSDSGRRFYEKDLEFATELARRTTLAIDNANLYMKMQDTNSELELRVAHRTSELQTINKELEAFSYSVSHDLRAPLRSIDGFSNKILKDYGALLDEQGKDYFMRVMKASKNMGHLIDALLKLARISRMDMNFEEIDLSSMAMEITNELIESNPERKAVIEIQPEMKARGDRNLIQIALQNMLDNAWKYSKFQPITQIEFGTIPGEQVTYFIRDNGVGFDMKYSDKLFGAFQRLHSQSEFEGTGVGLATVQRIIRRHQGSIRAESEMNKGTTFIFTI